MIKSISKAQARNLCQKPLRPFLAPGQDPPVPLPDTAALAADATFVAGSLLGRPSAEVADLLSSQPFVEFLAWQRLQTIKADLNGHGTQSRSHPLKTIHADYDRNPFHQTEGQLMAVLEVGCVRIEMRTPSLAIGRARPPRPSSPPDATSAAPDVLSLTPEFLATAFPSATGTVDLSTVSKCHCRIVSHPSFTGFELLNDSHNGTRVDGTLALDEPHPLRHNSTIQVGGILLRFLLAAAAPPP